MGTIIVGLILVLIVSLIIRSMVKDKKSGKSIQCGGSAHIVRGHCSPIVTLLLTEIKYNYSEQLRLDQIKERSVDMLQKANQNLPINDVGIHRTQMQKEIILQKLKERGCRITRQRKMLLDVILNEDCSSCKEIYYKASMKDSGIGTATVYRMINILEEIGALSRKNMYKIACGPECEVKDACVIEFDDDTIIELSGKSWNQVVQLGLRACGYSSGHKIKSVTAKSCEFSR